MLHRRKALSLIAGAAAATGFQPLGLWPVTLAAVALLVWLVATARNARSAALVGWLFGVGHFAIGNTWIATAFTYQAQMPAWLGWIAVVLLSLYLAVFPAVTTLGAWLVTQGKGIDRKGTGFVPVFAGCWIVGEWLRSWVFTGFAWNPLAMVTLGGFARPGLASVAPWMGTYAVSGLVVLLAGCWLHAVRACDGGSRGKAATSIALPVALMLLPIGGSAKQGTLPFTLVQPDRRQEELNDPSKFEAQFQTIAGLSLARHPGERRLVLWPESGVPDYLRPGYPSYFYGDTTYAADPALARARMGRVIGPGSLLLTGTTDLVMQGPTVIGAHNVVTALDSAGTIRGSYAKAHLVPYGEYLPLRWLLEPLGASRLVAGSIDFFPGPGPRTVDFGALRDGGWGRVGYQICYEIIFSGEVVDRAHRPDFIFNPSNDGWFGAWGPPQHLAQARMRAIEEGLPVLRSTTTGISAVIGADGVVRQVLPHHVRGRIDGLVPPALPPTLFARWGNALALGWAIALLVLGTVAIRRGRR
ncbi:apolipoprotein N-acyltransferase [Novosphingobium lentum]|uniref:apolipoprotein N-acyltransferase n=1 Tax=Novosphingobium lentum TaxID=145287 RepID=UPI0008374D0A|nr:apolipoprotein N-acyltransferase [Novosphingobium lentum]